MSRGIVTLNTASIGLIKYRGQNINKKTYCSLLSRAFGTETTVITLAF